MRRWAIAGVLLLVAASWRLVASQPGSVPNTVQLNGQTFTLPPSFAIELAAGPPLVDRPITAAFDEQGRLYVADSSGSNEKVEQQLAKKPHRIVRLEDADGDGKFDRSVVFADKMMFPEGTMWFAGSLYVAAPPSIWKLTDTDGDGVADQRFEWFQGRTLTGCANDLHGPYLGPDGWIYWCKGAFAKQTYERPGRPPLVTRAAHIFRARPDGTGIEAVMTGGMDNPVDVVFTPGGERIFTTTFFQHPGGGKRDGLVHAIYGGIYGKDHDPIYEHPWTSPSLMPVLVHMGPAAPAGLERYESEVFGKEYRDNLFACQFNLHKVSRHVLTPSGATFSTQDSDFLVSDHVDFHPTDVVEDADGSLLVVDTGGWYKLCCPSSQLHKPDVLGAIYRVRRKGAPKLADPRGLKLAWTNFSAADLTGLLNDPRPAVRRRAVQALADQGASAVPELLRTVTASPASAARLHAVWAATRIAAAAAREPARKALLDADATVRQAAIHAVSVWRDPAAVPQLLRLLKEDSPANRRAAAEALGRIGAKAAVPDLLQALATAEDRVLEHSLTFALLEIADPGSTAAGLKSGKVQIRRAALVALDQMGKGHVQPETVIPLLASAEPVLKETAWWIVGRHPEWAEALAGFLRERLAAPNLEPAAQEELVRQLARFGRSPRVQQLLADHLHDTGLPRQARQVVLQAMARSGLRELPAAWRAALTRILTGDDAELIREAVAVVKVLPAPRQGTAELAAALRKVAGDPKAAELVRLQALAAVPGELTALPATLFTFLLEKLRIDQTVAVRSAAADVMARARLDAEQLKALARSLKQVGPMELDRVLEPFAHSTEEATGLALLAELKDSSLRPALRVDMLRPRLAKYSPVVQQQAEALYALLDADLAKQRARLDELLAALKDGDIRRGQAVFVSQKATCSACHAVGYLGGNIGPDLTKIGSIRTERDLLEAIVFPSASFVRSYEPVVVTTRSGKIYNGVIRQDTPELLVLATGAHEEARIPREDVEEVQPGKVSVMPAGLDQHLTVRDLADLVAFLKACK